MRVTLPYPPSANRYLRHTARGTYRTREADYYRNYAAAMARDAGAKMLAGPVSILAILHPRMTKKGKASETRIDLDNCCKVSLDALQGIAYEDDKQVHRIVMEVGAPVMGGGLTLEVKPAMAGEFEHG